MYTSSYDTFVKSQMNTSERSRDAGTPGHFQGAFLRAGDANNHRPVASVACDTMMPGHSVPVAFPLSFAETTESIFELLHRPRDILNLLMYSSRLAGFVSAGHTRALQHHSDEEYPDNHDSPGPRRPARCAY